MLTSLKGTWSSRRPGKEPRTAEIVGTCCRIWIKYHGSGVKAKWVDEYQFLEAKQALVTVDCEYPFKDFEFSESEGLCIFRGNFCMFEGPALD